MERALLVTGATGFVGSHIAEAAVEAGWSVRCTVRSTSDTRWIDRLDVERVEVDLRDPGGLSLALRDVGAVIHAAGLTRARSEREYRRVNAEATARLAGAAAAHGVERFVFVSSLAARGPDGAAGPVGAYGRSKRAGEEALLRLEGDMEVVILRPAAVYGPRDTDLLALFRLAARGWLPVPTGAGPLQPVFAADVARAAVVAAGRRPDPGRELLPVAEPGRHRWRDVGEYLERALGRRVRLLSLPPGMFETVGLLSEAVARLARRQPALDRRRARDLARHAYTCDPRPAEEALGWQAAVLLPEGLTRSVRWYRAAGWLRGG